MILSGPSEFKLIVPNIIKSSISPITVVLTNLLMILSLFLIPYLSIYVDASLLSNFI